MAHKPATEICMSDNTYELIMSVMMRARNVGPKPARSAVGVAVEGRKNRK